jgi:hypothetical protein
LNPGFGDLEYRRQSARTDVELLNRSRDRLSLLKILSEQKLERQRKPRATSRDEPALVAGCSTRSRRAIQI